MILAKIDGKLAYPKPGLKAQCPSCKEEVLAKCGIINIWHWSHKNDTECDGWSEPETEWHYNWKTLFPIEDIEVTIGGEHRADVFWMGRVIEFQHSTISAEDIIIRESYYGNMFWVIDGNEFKQNLRFGRGYCRWKWLRKSWRHSERNKFIQVDNLIYYVISMNAYGFNYKILTLDQFKKEYLNLRVI